MSQPEAAIKLAVSQYLGYRGWYVIPIQQGAPGLPVRIHRGISDLICVKDGRVVFLEVKTPKGKQSEYQKQFEEQITKHGGEYRITRGIDDLGDLA